MPVRASASASAIAFTECGGAGGAGESREDRRRHCLQRDGVPQTDSNGQEGEGALGVGGLERTRAWGMGEWGMGLGPFPSFPRLNSRSKSQGEEKRKGKKASGET